jgi:hypothetical protein
MSTNYKKKSNFFETEEGIATAEKLKKMMTDPTCATKSSSNVNKTLYPDNLINFVDKHMCYLRDHPATDPGQYLANLRLMTRIK